MATLAQLTEEAWRHHQAGRLVEAQALYRRILNAEPRQAEIQAKLGLLLAQKGELAAAVECFRRALALKPDLAEARYFLGKALGELGDRAAARQCYEAVLAREPDHPEVHCELGNLLHEQGDDEGAATQFRRALALAPAYAQAHHNLAVVLAKQGDLVAAIAAYRTALAHAPAYADAHSNLGTALLDQGELAAAIASYRQALRLAPDDVAAYRGLGTAYHRQGDAAAAEQCFRHALALNPNDPAAHSDLGVLLAEREEWEAALACYARALALRPDYAEARMNVGLVHFYRGELAAAEAEYRRALALEPGNAEIHTNLGMALLLGGDLVAGWPEYEFRRQMKVWGKPAHSLAQPLWRGEALAGARILIHAEQGLGDSLQFVRYLPLVAARGGRVVLEVPHELQRLLTGVAGVVEVIVPEEAAQDIAWQCPLLSLPGVFGTELATIPAQIPYLHADPAEAARWQARLAGERMRVGLVWAGRPEHRPDRDRSLPLSALAPLAAIGGVDLYALQKGPDATQSPPAGMRLVDLAPLLADFAATAAALTALDLIISVDTSVAHLAGAMGKPVWILLRHQADWRWLRERMDSPWYPSARLYRQPATGGWGLVIARVAAELQALAAARQ